MEKNLGFSAKEYRALAGFDTDWRDLFWSDDFLALLWRRWGVTEAPRVLDVGCGAGHWGQRLATLADGVEVVGVDHEPAFLDAARERAATRGTRFDAEVGRAESLPFADDSFDLVTCHTVLIHVADADDVVREMARVTRPGGLVVLAEPNNRINLMVSYATLPAAPWAETRALLDLDHACLEGKRALGQGDNAVGERLAALLRARGLEDVQMCSNERCSWLAPPYDTEHERFSIEMMRAWAGRDVSRWGDADTARALYVAGGGEPAAFDDLFARLLAEQRRTLALIDSEELVWGGGHSMYVAWGRA